MADRLTRELANGDYQSRPSAKKEEILNEMRIILEWVAPSSKVLIDNLEFHTKSRSRFGLLSTAYLIAQIFSLLELQISHL